MKATKLKEIADNYNTADYDPMILTEILLNFYLYFEKEARIGRYSRSVSERDIQIMYPNNIIPPAKAPIYFEKIKEDLNNNGFRIYEEKFFNNSLIIEW